MLRSKKFSITRISFSSLQSLCPEKYFVLRENTPKCSTRHAANFDAAVENSEMTLKAEGQCGVSLRINSKWLWRNVLENKRIAVSLTIAEKCFPL